MTAPHRRGACPGLSAPMLTGDGLLVRLMPAGRLPARRFRRDLCGGADARQRRIEITARGSLQMRGLDGALGAAARAPTSPRSISRPSKACRSSPIRSPARSAARSIDAAGLAAALRRALADAGLALAPKVSVVIDGGGPLHLDALNADLRLRAVASARRRASMSRWRAMPGRRRRSDRSRATRPPTWCCVCSARSRRGARGARSRFLRTDGIGAFRSAVAGSIDVAPALPPRPPAEPIGRHPLRDGSLALGLALAFGHAHASALEQLTRRRRRPRGQCACGPRRAAHSCCSAVAPDGGRADRRGRAAGFVVRADDPRRRIVGLSRQAGLRVGIDRGARARNRDRAAAAAVAQDRRHPRFGLRQRLRPSGARRADRGRVRAWLRHRPRRLGARDAALSRRCRRRRRRGRAHRRRTQRAASMAEPQSYLRDGAAIYQRSFAIIRAEADLSRFSAEEAEVAVRMIHACGHVEAAKRHRVRSRARGRRPLGAGARARRSCATPRWWRTASRARGCRRATR